MSTQITRHSTVRVCDECASYLVKHIEDHKQLFIVLPDLCEFCLKHVPTVATVSIGNDTNFVMFHMAYILDVTWDEDENLDEELVIDEDTNFMKVFRE